MLVKVVRLLLRPRDSDLARTDYGVCLLRSVSVVHLKT